MLIIIMFEQWLCSNHVSQTDMTVWQWAGHWDSAKWDPAIINFIIYACAFSSLTCQDVLREKTLLHSLDYNQEVKKLMLWWEN